MYYTTPNSVCQDFFAFHITSMSFSLCFRSIAIHPSCIANPPPFTQWRLSGDFFINYLLFSVKFDTIINFIHNTVFTQKQIANHISSTIFRIFNTTSSGISSSKSRKVLPVTLFPVRRLYQRRPKAYLPTPKDA